MMKECSLAKRSDLLTSKVPPAAIVTPAELTSLSVMYLTLIELVLECMTTARGSLGA